MSDGGAGCIAVAAAGECCWEAEVLEGVIQVLPPAGQCGSGLLCFDRSRCSEQGCHYLSRVAVGGRVLTMGCSDVTQSTAAGPEDCAGDCNQDGEVTIDELLAMVNIALGLSPPFRCRAADADCSGSVGVNELVGAVRHALAGDCAPELGLCYESSTCAADPSGYLSFPASRARCCKLWRDLDLPFTWCADGASDSATGSCNQCWLPC